MFESILEKILQKNLGQFISGLDSKNLHLGVWSGNIIIENVAVKPEALQLLGLPCKLLFSYIGRLQLKVPWKSLSSSPVEVMLENVFLIISLKKEEEWSFSDINLVKKKIEQLDKFSVTYDEKLKTAEGKEISQKDSTFLERLTMKILDNLQVTIKNIHVRIENEKHSFGLTLERLEVYTTNEAWKKMFFDRTDLKNKEKPMFKLLQLQKIALYWNENEKELLGALKDAVAIRKRMHLLANGKEPLQNVISISAEAKLIQNMKKDDFSKPEYNFTINLGRIDIQLSKNQMQQIVFVIEHFGKFQARVDSSSKMQAFVGEEKLKSYENRFKLLYTKVWSGTTEQKNVDILDKEELIEFERIIGEVDFDIICLWTKIVIKDVEKMRQIAEIEEKKRKEKSGWFSSVWGKNKETEYVTKEDREKLDKFFEDNFNDEVIDITRPADFVWFYFDLSLEGGSLKLTQSGFNEEKLGIILDYNGFKSIFKLRQKNSESAILLKGIRINMDTEYAENKKSILTNFLTHDQLSGEEKGNFLSLKFEKNPMEIVENQVKIDWKIAIKMASPKIMYNPSLVERLNSIFSLKTDEGLKNSTWDKLEETIDKQQINARKLQVQTVLQIHVHLDAPLIIVPFIHNDDSANECWVFRLGDLDIKTNEQNLSVLHRDEDKDILDFNLCNIRMEYFQSIFAFENNQKEKSYKLIEDFSILISVKILKKEIENRALVEIIGNLPNLNLKINTNIYSKLLNIEKCFSLNSEVDLELVQKERITLVSNAKKIGEIYRRGGTLHSWKKYFAILSGGYVYFFAKATDPTPETYIYFRHAEIKDLGNSLDIPNSFSIKYRYREEFLACEKEQTAQEWLNLLQQKKQNYMQQLKDDNKTTKVEKKKENPKMIQFVAKFDLESIVLSLHDRFDAVWMDFKTSHLMFSCSKRPYDMAIQMKLGSILLKDHLREYLNPEIVPLIASLEEKVLVHIGITLIEKEHPEYKHIDMEMDISFETLQINYKPDTILSIIAFFKPENIAEKTEKITEIQEIPLNELEKSNANLAISKAETILLRLKLQMTAVSVNFVHRKNNLILAKLRLQNGSIALDKKQDEMNLEGSLGNIQLFDCTNYPNSIFRENEYNKCIPKEILGISGEKASLLTIKFTSYTEGSPKIKNSIENYVKIGLNSVFIDLSLQPILRLVDYVLVQIMLLLTESENFSDEIHKKARLVKELDKELIEKKKAKFLKEIQKRFERPSWTDVVVKGDRPLVVLKARPEDKDYMEIDLGKIEVANERIFDKNRVKGKGFFLLKVGNLEGLWVEMYKIWMRELSVRLVIAGQENPISQNFNFNLCVGLPKFVEEIRTFYGAKVALDSTLSITSKLLPVVITLTREQYLSIMRIIFFNITYDDLLDKFFIHDYEKQEKKDSDPISFCLDIENISLFAIKDLVPFVRLTSEKMRITYYRFPNKKALVKIASGKIDASQFKKEFDNKLIEKHLLGQFFAPKEHQVLAEGIVVNDLDNRIQIVRNYKEFENSEFFNEFSFKEFNTKNLHLDLELIMTPDRTKDISIKIAYIRITSEIGIFLDISAFTQMDSSVEPPEPIVLKEFELNQLKEPLPEKENTGMQEGTLKVSVDISKVVVIMPCPDSREVLATRGEMSVLVYIQPSRSVNFLVKEIAENKISYEQSYDLNEVMKVSLALHDLEVFICSFKELIYKDFRQVKKRNILLPFSMFFNLKDYLALNEKKYFFPKRRIDANIEKTIVRLAFRDISIVNETITYQLESLWDSDFWGTKKVEEEKILEEEKLGKVANLKEGEISDFIETHTKAFISNIQFIMINDTGESLTPIFQLELNEVNTLFTQNPIMSKGSIIYVVSSSYLNLINGHWEPFIERTCFDLDISKNINSFFNPLEKRQSSLKNVIILLINYLLKAFSNIASLFHFHPFSLF